jgi:hypothetical protein
VDLSCLLQVLITPTTLGICIELSGRSIDMKRPDKFFDGINIPSKDSWFGGLLCLQVHEHIDNIDLHLSGCDSAIEF